MYTGTVSVPELGLSVSAPVWAIVAVVIANILVGAILASVRSVSIQAIRFARWVVGRARVLARHWKALIPFAGWHLVDLEIKHVASPWPHVSRRIEVSLAGLDDPSQCYVEIGVEVENYLVVPITMIESDCKIASAKFVGTGGYERDITQCQWTIDKDSLVIGECQPGTHRLRANLDRSTAEEVKKRAQSHDLTFQLRLASEYRTEQRKGPFRMVDDLTWHCK